MSLLERITMLVRSNLNDLLDKAEDPEKMVKQIIMDIETELRELKSRVAVSIADRRLLEQKRDEYRDKTAEWMRKAELALDGGEEATARGALERHLSFQRLAAEAEKQVDEQQNEVAGLKSLLAGLEQKLEEARSRGETLIAQSRRSQTLDKASKARAAVESRAQDSALDRLGHKVEFTAAVSRAGMEMAEEDLERKLGKMEKDRQVDSLLADLKRKRGSAS